MTKYIIFDDGYHSEIVFNNQNEYLTIQDLFRKLASPHTDYVGIAIIKYEDVEENDTAPVELLKCVNHIEWGAYFTKKEFNLMWQYSYPVTDW